MLLLCAMQSAQHTVISKKCHLYQRSNTLKWYVRIKVNNGKWERFSTNEYDVDAAREKAMGMYYEAQVKAKNNLPQTTRTFSAVAKAIADELEAKRGTAEWKDTYKSYIIVIRNYLIPFFKQTKLDNLKDKYQRYKAWTTERNGGKPLASSSLAKHNTALNLIFDKAMERGWATISSIPNLNKVESDKNRRPDFSRAEYLLMIRAMRTWRTQKTHRAIDQEIHEMLYDYVLFLANSGVRPGKESMKLQWNNIAIQTSRDGNEIITANVGNYKGRSGKIRRREVVLRNAARSSARLVLERLKNRDPEFQPLTLEQILELRSTKLVFRLRNGSQPARLDGTFKKFLKEHNMLVGTDNQNRSLYSLRHFYATQELLRENPVSLTVLAQQMGTSVAMIEKYYGHVTAMHKADRLAGFGANQKT
jgi:integrase